MNSFTTQNNQGIAISLMFLLLASCGAEKISSDASASTNQPSGTIIEASIDSDESVKPIMNCNEKNMSFLNLKIKKDTRNPDNQLIAYFSSVKINWDKGEKVYFYRGKVSTSNVVTVETTPISIGFETKDGSTAFFGSYQGLTKANLLNAAAQVASGYSVSSLLANYRFIFSIYDAQHVYQFIRAVKFDSNNEYTEYRDILIPSFYANPNDYQKSSLGTVRPIDLVSLHPFYNQMDDTDLDFATLASEACN